MADISTNKETSFASNRLFPLLSSISRPLSFALKDDFAHLSTVKGLEHLVETVCNEAAFLGLSEGLLERFFELKELFKGFDSLSPEIKKERILRAEKMVGALKEIASPPARNDGKIASSPLKVGGR